MTEQEIIFLAGILDYTGSFKLFQSPTGRSSYPIIRISSENRSKIELIAKMLGINVIKGRYSTAVTTGRKAQAVIAAIAPFLVLHKEEADAVIAWEPLPGRATGIFRIACSQQCGNMMVRGCLTCMKCYRAKQAAQSQKTRDDQALAKAKKAAAKTGPKPNPLTPSPAAPKNFLVSPPVRRHELTLTGRGEIVNTPTGRIHRMRG